MARQLIEGGYPLLFISRTKEKAIEIYWKKVPQWAETPKEVAEKANVIFTIVGYPKDVEEVYLGKQGLIQMVKKEAYIIDMTTSAPLLQRKYMKEQKRENTVNWMHLFLVEISGQKRQAFNHGWWG